MASPRNSRDLFEKQTEYLSSRDPFSWKLIAHRRPSHVLEVPFCSSVSPTHPQELPTLPGEHNTKSIKQPSGRINTPSRANGDCTKRCVPHNFQTSEIDLSFDVFNCGTPDQTIAVQRGSRNLSLNKSHKLEDQVPCAQYAEDSELEAFAPPRSHSVLLNLHQRLKHDDWQKQFNALTDFRRLLKHHSSLLLSWSNPGPHEKKRQVGKLTSGCALVTLLREALILTESLRSNVAKNATLAIHDVFLRVPQLVTGQSVVEEAFGCFVKRASGIVGGSSFLVDEAERTLLQICSTTHPAKLVACILKQLETGKNPKIQARCFWCVSKVFDSLDFQPLISQQQFMKELGTLASVLHTALSSPSEICRKSAREAIKRLITFLGPYTGLLSEHCSLSGVELEKLYSCCKDCGEESPCAIYQFPRSLTCAKLNVKPPMCTSPILSMCENSQITASPCSTMDNSTTFFPNSQFCNSKHPGIEDNSQKQHKVTVNNEDNEFEFQQTLESTNPSCYLDNESQLVEIPRNEKKTTRSIQISPKRSSEMPLSQEILQMNQTSIIKDPSMHPSSPRAPFTKDGSFLFNSKGSSLVYSNGTRSNSKRKHGGLSNKKTAEEGNKRNLNDCSHIHCKLGSLRNDRFCRNDVEKPDDNDGVIDLSNHFRKAETITSSVSSQSYCEEIELQPGYSLLSRTYDWESKTKASIDESEERFQNRNDECFEALRKQISSISSSDSSQFLFGKTQVIRNISKNASTTKSISQVPRILEVGIRRRNVSTLGSIQPLTGQTNLISKTTKKRPIRSNTLLINNVTSQFDLHPNPYTIGQTNWHRDQRSVYSLRPLKPNDTNILASSKILSRYEASSYADNYHPSIPMILAHSHLPAVRQHTVQRNNERAPFQRQETKRYHSNEFEIYGRHSIHKPLKLNISPSRGGRLHSKPSSDPCSAEMLGMRKDRSRCRQHSSLQPLHVDAVKPQQSTLQDQQHQKAPSPVVRLNSFCSSRTNVTTVSSSSPPEPQGYSSVAESEKYPLEFTPKNDRIAELKRLHSGKHILDSYDVEEAKAALCEPRNTLKLRRNVMRSSRKRPLSGRAITTRNISKPENSRVEIVSTTGEQCFSKKYKNKRNSQKEASNLKSSSKRFNSSTTSYHFMNLLPKKRPNRQSLKHFDVPLVISVEIEPEGSKSGTLKTTTYQGPSPVAHLPILGASSIGVRKQPSLSSSSELARSRDNEISGSSFHAEVRKCKTCNTKKPAKTRIALANDDSRVPSSILSPSNSVSTKENVERLTLQKASNNTTNFTVACRESFCSISSHPSRSNRTHSADHLSRQLKGRGAGQSSNTRLTSESVHFYPFTSVAKFSESEYPSSRILDNAKREVPLSDAPMNPALTRNNSSTPFLLDATLPTTSTSNSIQRRTKRTSRDVIVANTKSSKKQTEIRTTGGGQLFTEDTSYGLSLKERKSCVKNRESCKSPKDNETPPKHKPHFATSEISLDAELSPFNITIVPNTPDFSHNLSKPKINLTDEEEKTDSSTINNSALVDRRTTVESSTSMKRKSKLPTDTKPEKGESLVETFRICSKEKIEDIFKINSKSKTKEYQKRKLKEKAKNNMEAKLRRLCPRKKKLKNDSNNSGAIEAETEIGMNTGKGLLYFQEKKKLLPTSRRRFARTSENDQEHVTTLVPVSSEDINQSQLTVSPEMPRYPRTKIEIKSRNEGIGERNGGQLTVLNIASVETDEPDRYSIVHSSNVGTASVMNHEEEVSGETEGDTNIMTDNKASGSNTSAALLSFATAPANDGRGSPTTAPFSGKSLLFPNIANPSVDSATMSPGDSEKNEFLLVQKYIPPLLSEVIRAEDITPASSKNTRRTKTSPHISCITETYMFHHATYIDKYDPKAAKSLSNDSSENEIQDVASREKCVHRRVRKTKVNTLDGLGLNDSVTTCVATRDTIVPFPKNRQVNNESIDDQNSEREYQVLDLGSPSNISNVYGLQSSGVHTPLVPRLCHVVKPQQIQQTLVTRQRLYSSSLTNLRSTELSCDAEKSRSVLDTCISLPFSPMIEQRIASGTKASLSHEKEKENISFTRKNVGDRRNERPFRQFLVSRSSQDISISPKIECDVGISTQHVCSSETENRNCSVDSKDGRSYKYYVSKQFRMPAIKFQNHNSCRHSRVRIKSSSQSAIDSSSVSISTEVQEQRSRSMPPLVTTDCSNYRGQKLKELFVEKKRRSRHCYGLNNYVKQESLRQEKKGNIKKSCRKSVEKICHQKTFFRLTPDFSETSVLRRGQTEPSGIRHHFEATSDLEPECYLRRSATHTFPCSLSGDDEAVVLTETKTTEKDPHQCIVSCERHMLPQKGLTIAEKGTFQTPWKGNYPTNIVSSNPESSSLSLAEGKCLATLWARHQATLRQITVDVIRLASLILKLVEQMDSDSCFTLTDNPLRGISPYSVSRSTSMVTEQHNLVLPSWTLLPHLKRPSFAFLQRGSNYGCQDVNTCLQKQNTNFTPVDIIELVQLLLPTSDAIESRIKYLTSVVCCLLQWSAPLLDHEASNVKKEQCNIIHKKSEHQKINYQQYDLTHDECGNSNQDVINYEEAQLTTSSLFLKLIHVQLSQYQDESKAIRQALNSGIIGYNDWFTRVGRVISILSAELSILIEAISMILSTLTLSE